MGQADEALGEQGNRPGDRTVGGEERNTVAVTTAARMNASPSPSRRSAGSTGSSLPMDRTRRPDQMSGTQPGGHEGATHRRQTARERTGTRRCRGLRSGLLGLLGRDCAWTGWPCPDCRRGPRPGSKTPGLRRTVGPASSRAPSWRRSSWPALRRCFGGRCLSWPRSSWRAPLALDLLPLTSGRGTLRPVRSPHRGRPDCGPHFTQRRHQIHDLTPCPRGGLGATTTPSPPSNLAVDQGQECSR